MHTSHDSTLSSTRRLRYTQHTVIYIPREDRFYIQFQSSSNLHRVSQLHWIQVKFLKTLRKYQRFTQSLIFNEKGVPLNTDDQDKAFIRKMIRKIEWRRNQIQIILYGFPSVEKDLRKWSHCPVAGLRRSNMLYSHCPNLVNPISNAQLSCFCTSCKLNVFADIIWRFHLSRGMTHKQKFTKIHSTRNDATRFYWKRKGLESWFSTHK